MRSAPERYGSVRAARRRRSSALGTKQQSSREQRRGDATLSDEIWLARQGWRVRAVDVSATALDRAATDAATAGVADRIDFRQHDLALTFPSGAFDLVSAQYLHSPIEFPRARVLREATSAVTPYGLLLIVDHASVSPGSWADPEETLAPLDLSPDEWHTERLEAREREATGPNGQRATVTDNVIAVRRLTRPQ